MEWSKDNEKKILNKYRFTLTMTIIRVIAASLFFFWLYMLVVTISYQALHFGEKHSFYSKLAMDWTQPNMHEDFGSFDSTEINPFFTQKITYPVFKMIGKETERIGEMQLSKRLITPFSSRTLEYIKPKQEKEYSFYLPKHPKTGTTLDANEDPSVWSKLERVHEGTVAELSFSTKDYMTPEEMHQFLDSYDLDILWMPLYAGEMKEFDTSWGGGGNSISLFYNFGFTGGREISDDYKSRSKYLLEPRLVDENKRIMLSQMKKLLDNESESYYENFLGIDHLEERYNYLMEHGFNVYGAVVTGPVKELIKLKESQQIQGAKLGEMSYWNWVE